MEFTDLILIMMLSLSDEHVGGPADLHHFDLKMSLQIQTESLCKAGTDEQRIREKGSLNHSEAASPEFFLRLVVFLFQHVFIFCFLLLLE